MSKKERNARSYAKHAEERRAYSKAYRAAHPEQVKASLRAWNEKNKVEQAATKKAHYEANKAERLARQKAYYEANREACKASAAAYRTANQEKHRAHALVWAKNNPARHRANGAAHDASKVRATIKWANRFFIAEAYDLAKCRERCLGGKWQVDHVVPLRSKIVCGLHVENNLRVIPARLNASKGNRHWPDMP